MSGLTPLTQWLLRQPDAIVARTSTGALHTQALVARVSAWRTALAALPGRRIALYHGDSGEFLAILLALWQSGRIACIASDNRAATAAQLGARVDGFAGEFPAVPGVLAEPAAECTQPVEWLAPDADEIALEIYTSGSSGVPKAIAKTFAQLQAELAALETLWPGEAGGAVLSTVTHQHFYGLVIALLWPFCAGRTIDTRLCEFPEDIIHRGAQYDRFVLVSSPSHLARFGPALDWQALAGRCAYAISSAAPLNRADSLAAAALLAAPVREIYGSTETGAIAWRCQQDQPGDAQWQALPGVRLAATEEDTLSVRAPYLDVEELVLPDRVEFDASGRFRLLGRVDRVVKVEGKRVSLSAIESLLGEHDWVSEVRALTLQRARVETAIVMRLSAAGETRMREVGRKALVREFKALLDGQLEPVLVPRRWRFVEQMPYNRQGKLPLQDLEILFGRDDVNWPQILEHRLQPGQLQLRCRIAQQLEYFDGHMPGRPILPGIVQVHWAEAFARRWLRVEGRFQSLEGIKFQQVIVPGDELLVRLEFDADSGKLHFRYESDQGVHSRGRICFSR